MPVSTAAIEALMVSLYSESEVSNTIGHLLLTNDMCLFFSCFFPHQQSNKVPVVQHAHHVHPLTPLITYSNEHFSPGTPPSHLSPEILDPKTGEVSRTDIDSLQSVILKGGCESCSFVFSGAQRLHSVTD